MFNNKKRKESRINSNIIDSISGTKYNVIIGLMLIYGFIMNAILVKTATTFVSSLHPAVLLIGYFVIAIFGSILVNKSNNPIYSFIGYNMICIPIGALLSICIPGYDPSLILSAIIVTGIIK